MSTEAYSEFQAAMRRRDWGAAIALAERLLAEADGGQAFWLTQLARARRGAGRLKEAVAAADEAVALAPGDGYAYLARGDALRDNGQTDDAIADYRMACRDRRTRAWGLRGGLSCLQAKEDWVAILKVAADPDLPENEQILWRARGLAGTNNLPAAEEACREGLGLFPDDPPLLWELTELDVRTQGLENTLCRFRRMAKIPSRPAVYGKIYAALCRRAGRGEEELKQYELLAEKMPDVGLLRRKAFSLARNGHEAEAIPLLEELLRENPQDTYIHNAYAGACRRIGQLDRAREFYPGLIRLHPHVGPLYGRLKRLEKPA